MIRRRYLSRIFIGRFLAALLGLAALLQLLDLLDRASEVLHRGGIEDLARYAALRLPTVLGQMVPLATLVAGMLTFRRLAMTLEMTALRASGIPVRRVLVTLLPVCLAAALAQGVLLGFVAPRTERMLAEWWESTESRALAPASAPPRVWLRAGSQIVGIDRVSLDGAHLQGLLLVPRAEDGVARARIEADSAVHDGAGWTLQGVRVAEPGGTRLVRQATRPWPEGPPPAEIIELARPTESQDPWWLLRALRREQAVDRGPAFYATRLQNSFARLLAPFLMLLLAAPVAFEMPRRGGGGLRPLLGLSLGLGYLLLGGLLTALGEAGVAPVALSVWTAPIVFAALGGMLLIRFEEQ
ncbi:LptF/LptG family permease [Roseomonas marmotae]|uniref:LptF/LptG family permease n=1 Tax=Roseomonas marmotae TaxID=2768161 RepID=A0ABS3KGY8_9PROT|nr:LptF/LptG family permease [Roseomonas marmotae]MBO1075873.1 LptF/LptG family permease [Roseomonas marmotae]QTI81939.1 LptF/LptG family permease [Roseomonas marmotae]